jgi:MoxR-like ATPase
MQEGNDRIVLERLSEACQRLRGEMAKVVVGQEAVVEELLISLFAQGHALLVGVPGLAKTLLVSTFAHCLDLTFGRVQFTPDLLPADITGTDVLAEAEVDGRIRHETRFLPGPVFSHLLLADEINRTPPKTQAALLQAMQEGSVTVGGHTHRLPAPFQVLATQNPIEQEGTYPLPEAQLDRFLLEIRVGYPSEQDELEIARRTTRGSLPTPEKVLTQEELGPLLNLIPRIPVTEAALALAVGTVRQTRPEFATSSMIQKYVRFGAGPRGSRAVVLAAKARAGILGRPVADIEDVLATMVSALRHRLVRNYRAEADGIEAHKLVEIARESAA